MQEKGDNGLTRDHPETSSKSRIFQKKTSSLGLHMDGNRDSQDINGLGIIFSEIEGMTATVKLEALALLVNLSLSEEVHQVAAALV